MHQALIVEGPLSSTPAPVVPGAGAVVVFDGVVRPLEGDRTITGLAYEAYRPMADRHLERLAAQIVERHGVLACFAWHSVGFVASGQVSFRLVIAGRHRRESLAAMDEFIDVMKRDVPIWKKPM
jgi:molybdopterin synthase catalytic subunit